MERGTDMSVQYTLPGASDFTALAQRRSNAISIYVATSPVVAEREVSFTATKGAFDRALEEVKAGGAPAAVRSALEAEWQRIASDEALWGNLAASLAIFVAPDFSEIFVLPNRLENQLQVAEYFDIGQLLRSVTYPQEAYAVLLSANEWSLWFATARDRAARVDVSVEHPANLNESMSRDPLLDTERQPQRLGDADRTAELDLYAKRVSDAVTKELARRDPGSSDVVFVFAAEPVLSLFMGHGVHERSLVPVPGASDRLGAADIDQAMRERLSEWNARTAQDHVDEIAQGAGAGLVEAELSTIARAAVGGSIGTLVFNFTVDINGTFDDATGAIEYAPDNGRTMADGSPAYDLLSRIAVTVLERGGTTVAVREDEVVSTLWNGTAIAGLRYAFT
jgi:hypothetical protein